MALTPGERIAEARIKAGFERQTHAAQESRRLEKLDPDRFSSFSSQWLSRLERDDTGEVVNSARGPKLRTLEHIIRLDLGAPRPVGTVLDGADDPVQPRKAVSLSTHPITEESARRGKLLEQARTKNRIALPRAAELAGLPADDLRKLEWGHALLDDLPFGVVKNLHLAYGISREDMILILGEGVLNYELLSDPLQQMARVLLKSGGMDA